MCYLVFVLFGDFTVFSVSYFYFICTVVIEHTFYDLTPLKFEICVMV